MKKEKHPNLHLRRERELRGWSQKLVAKHIGTDPQTVTRWELGENKPTRHFQTRLCELFGKNAEELGFMTTSQPVKDGKKGGEAETSPTNIGESDQQNHQLPLAPSAHHASSLLASILHESAPLNVVTSRRQMLQETLSLASVALLMPPQELLNGDALERVAFALKKPAGLDTRVIVDLRTITESYWRALSHGAPLPDLLYGASGHFRTIIHLFQRPHPLSLQRDLSALTRDTAQLLGHILFDIRDFSSAWSYYTLAEHAAQSAAQSEGEAALLFRTSFLFTDVHETPSEALVVLERAQQLTRQSPIASLRARLAVRKAEVHSVLNQRTACQRELEMAETLILDLDASSDVVPDLATNFDTALFAGYKGVCLLRLGEAEAALKAFEEAHRGLQIELCHDAVLLTDLALAHVQLGDYVQACTYAYQALTHLGQRNNASNLYRLLSLRHYLEAWALTSEVKELDHRIAVV